MRRLLLCLLAIPAACGCPGSDPPPPAPVARPAPTPADPPTFEYRPRRAPVDGPIRRGPYVQAVGTTEAIVCFESVDPVEGKVECDGRTAAGPRGLRHEIALKDLKPGTRYTYTIRPGGTSGSFKTPIDGDGDLFFIAW